MYVHTPHSGIAAMVVVGHTVLAMMTDVVVGCSESMFIYGFYVFSNSVLPRLESFLTWRTVSHRLLESRRRRVWVMHRPLSTHVLYGQTYFIIF